MRLKPIVIPAQAGTQLDDSDAVASIPRTEEMQCRVAAGLFWLGPGLRRDDDGS